MASKIMINSVLILSIVALVCAAVADNDQESVQSNPRTRRHHGGGHHGGFHHGGFHHGGWRGGWGGPFWGGAPFFGAPYLPPAYFGGIPPVAPIGVGQPWLGPVPVGAAPVWPGEV